MHVRDKEETHDEGRKNILREWSRKHAIQNTVTQTMMVFLNIRKLRPGTDGNLT